MAPISPDPGFFRERLALARLMLVFTPEACGDRDPFAVLEAVAEHVDVIQVRPKPLGTGGAASPAEAAATHDWTRRVIESVAYLRRMPLVIVDDRVDVALALRDRRRSEQEHGGGAGTKGAKSQHGVGEREPGGKGEVRPSAHQGRSSARGAGPGRERPRGA